MSFLSILPGLLLGALAIVMLGLGLSLAVDDFRRLREHPKAVVLALVLQVVLLPGTAYLLIVATGMEPIFAVGLMLLAASPGGVSANLFSHLFGGNVALNISLTAINTVLSIISLPLIANWAIAAFVQSGQVVPLQFGKILEVMGIVLLPVGLGMLVRAKSPAIALRLDQPMKIFSAVVLAVFSIIAIAKEWQALSTSFASIGPVVLAFNIVSLLAGYYLSRAIGLNQGMATAISFEIGIHNSSLAMFVALSVLGSFQLALPAAVYSVSMYLTATLFGFLVLRRGASAGAGQPALIR
jgi:BASS family bile acid:Na+ symporter